MNRSEKKISKDGCPRPTATMNVFAVPVSLSNPTLKMTFAHTKKKQELLLASMALPCRSVARRDVVAQPCHPALRCRAMWPRCIVQAGVARATPRAHQSTWSSPHSRSILRRRASRSCSPHAASAPARAAAPSVTPAEVARATPRSHQPMQPRCCCRQRCCPLTPL